MRAASCDPLVISALRRLGDAQAEGHVLGDRHVRIKRVVLEHHGDAALGGGHVVHARRRRYGCSPL